MVVLPTKCDKHAWYGHRQIKTIMLHRLIYKKVLVLFTNRKYSLLFRLLFDIESKNTTVEHFGYQPNWKGYSSMLKQAYKLTFK